MQVVSFKLLAEEVEALESLRAALGHRSRAATIRAALDLLSGNALTNPFRAKVVAAARKKHAGARRAGQPFG